MENRIFWHRFKATSEWAWVTPSVSAVPVFHGIRSIIIWDAACLPRSLAFLQPRWALSRGLMLHSPAPRRVAVAWDEAWHQQPAAHWSLKLFAIISRKKSRRRRSDQLTVIRRRAKAPSPYHRDCSGVLLLLFSISSLVLYGAPAAGFKFSIIDSGVSGSKQIEGCCTIILITKENPDGFSFAGSLHGCVDRTMKRPWNIPEFLELLEDIRRTPPISIAENDQAIQGFAAGTQFKNVNLGLQVHSVPKRVNCLGSIWQRFHLSIKLDFRKRFML